MPDREFIHSSPDVASTLLYAIDSGLQVRLDEPQPEPRPRMLTRTDVVDITEGVFFLSRPEWVYGPLQPLSISRGHDRGKYDFSPRVNCSPITVLFQGERVDQGRRRLGDCVVSWHRDWLEMPAKIVRPTPPDVQVWFKRIEAHLSSGLVVKAGVHRYYISRGVVADPTSIECLPPFDFIPWGSEVLEPHGKRQSGDSKGRTKGDKADAPHGKRSIRNAGKK